MSETFAAIDEIAQLTIPNWDSYGAEPIAGETVSCARIFNGILPESLRTLNIAPGGDGSIGFEWHRCGDLKLWIDIEPGPKIKGVLFEGVKMVTKLNVTDPVAAAHWAIVELRRIEDDRR